MCIALGTSGILLRNSSSGLDSVMALLQGGVIVLLIVALMLTAESRHAKEHKKSASYILDLNKAIEEDGEKAKYKIASLK